MEEKFNQQTIINALMSVKIESPNHKQEKFVNVGVEACIRTVNELFKAAIIKATQP